MQKENNSFHLTHGVLESSAKKNKTVQWIVQYALTSEFGLELKQQTTYVAKSDHVSC